MNQPGLRGVRGIGGRIHFYANRNDQPIKVEGLLTVYAYDDSEEVGAQSVPVRKFAFLPEQLAKRHSVSKLGDSYNVWLPFDEVGGPTRQLTLIARFEPEGGASVMSDPARQLLPGVISKEKPQTAVANQETLSDSRIELAGFEEQSPPQEGVDGDALGTFTIDLPNEVARRWQAKTADALKRRVPAKRTLSARPAAAADQQPAEAVATAETTEYAPRRHVKTRPTPSDLLPRRSIAPVRESTPPATTPHETVPHAMDAQATAAQ